MALPLTEAIRPTTIIEAARLSEAVGADLILASETFQKTGSFKFRAAYNLALTAPHSDFIAASSGNFGQALAYSCRLLGKNCTIVMPDNSAQVKVEAVKNYGAAVDLLDIKTTSRFERVKQLAAENPEAYVSNAYDDPLIIEGNASLGDELAALDRNFDCVVVPIGGGGLSSGIITGLRRSGSNVEVVGAEPTIANDASRSLRAGHIVSNETEPQTIADGARTVSLGQYNWEVLKDGLSGIVEVPEEEIVAGVRLLFNLANLKAEPTGALAVAALLSAPDKFRDRKVCCVITGGNVDAAVYRKLLA